MSDDATADFLAREKAALGEDADFFSTDATTSAPTPSGLDAFPDLSSPAAEQPPAKAASPQPQGISAFPDLDSPGFDGTQVRVTGTAGLGEDPDREQFESAFPDLSGETGGEAAPKPVFNALSPQPYGASPYPATAAPAPRSANSILPAPEFNNILPTADEDSEPIKAWKAKQAEEIALRDEKDKKKKAEVKNAAERAIDAFYADYNKQKERNIRENKEQEAAFLEKLQESVAKGTSWERVSELICLENSQSKTIRPSVPGGSDLARMKEILLALRREGDKAPGASGF
ncbi:clathrin light chain [Cryptococcus wingfieldii CBS 7118]|uniref:Clathrin light chain n=1 Tax=Cryptococcus wingfieldii CBS 7118 TaxID=1295528 RepID=A0A1E3K5K5_9TREE|nr:clathrin light chain [Cryptococcus wingfieldii CBS 7118]ODO08341.1 clathrin light chain [Cryptococcus wingfieldii CBS 7118]